MSWPSGWKLALNYTTVLNSYIGLYHLHTCIDQYKFLKINFPSCIYISWLCNLFNTGMIFILDMLHFWVLESSWLKYLVFFSFPSNCSCLWPILITNVWLLPSHYKLYQHCQLYNHIVCIQQLWHCECYSQSDPPHQFHLIGPCLLCTLKVKFPYQCHTDRKCCHTQLMHGKPKDCSFPADCGFQGHFFSFCILQIGSGCLF